MTTISCWNFNNVREGLAVFDDVLGTPVAPVGWWKMNDNTSDTTVTDEMGAHNGVLSVNTNTRSIVGKINRALQLDGVSDTITIANHADFNFGIGEFSIAFWIYVPSTLGANQEYGVVCKCANYASSPGWGIEVSTWGSVLPSHVTISGFNTGMSVWANAYAGTLISTDTWHYVVFQRIGGALYLTIDAEFARGCNHADCALNMDNTQNVVIGDHSWGPNAPIAIDDLRIYRGAIDAEAIATLSAGTEDSVIASVGKHNGRVVGSLPLVNGPISNKARVFNGVATNYIVVPHHADFKIDTDWTIEVWANLAAAPSSYNAIVNKGDWFSGLPFMFLDWTSSAFLEAYVATTTSLRISLTADLATVAGRLYYLALTFKRSTPELLLYQNGVFVKSGTNSGYAGGDNTRDLKLGVNYDADSYPLKGSIHAVRWSNVVKTGKEIYDTYMAANVQET
jgi:hypothetical protein